MCKYDEMSMKVRSKVDHNTDAAAMKLVNIQVFWVALFEVDNGVVWFRTQLPAVVRLIEACTTNCMARALEDVTSFPAPSDGFRRKTRLSIFDKHRSSIAADDHMTAAHPNETLHRFHCFPHVGHKTADRLYDAYPNEKRGLLRSCLANSFGGTLALLKHNMKIANSKGFQWFDNRKGPGAEHDAYHGSF